MPKFWNIFNFFSRIKKSKSEKPISEFYVEELEHRIEHCFFSSKTNSDNSFTDVESSDNWIN